MRGLCDGRRQGRLDNRPMDRPASLLAVALVAALLAAGCSPTYNWRRVQPEGSAALAMFPCRPSHEVRQVTLAGTPVSLAVAACHAGDAMFALSYADVGELPRVAPALQALRDAAVANLRGQVIARQPAAVDGMTPSAAAEVLDVQGRLPDGDAVHERLAVFARGSRVYQATMFGRRLDSDATETFFQGLQLAGASAGS
jgi:hypothetical protein